MRRAWAWLNRWFHWVALAGVTVGFVVPFLPGGLGAREAALVAVVSPHYGLGAATGIALVARLAVTLGELLAVAAIWLSYGAARGARRLRDSTAGA